MSAAVQRGDAGFTLVEVLVGLMLTSVLVAALATLGSQFRTFLNANDRVEQSVELNAVARKIANVIEQAEALPIARNENGQDVFLAGNPDTIAFVATLKLGFRRSGFRRVKISAPAPGRLVMETGFQRPGEHRKENPKPTVTDLTAGDVAIRFRFLDLTPEQGQIRWTDSWQSPARLPRGVLVELTKRQAAGQIMAASAFAELWDQ